MKDTVWVLIFWGVHGFELIAVHELEGSVWELFWLAPSLSYGTVGGI